MLTELGSPWGYCPTKRELHGANGWRFRLWGECRGWDLDKQLDGWSLQGMSLVWGRKLSIAL